MQYAKTMAGFPQTIQPNLNLMQTWPITEFYYHFHPTAIF